MNYEIREYKNSDLVSLNYLLREVYQLEKVGTSYPNNIELVAVSNNIVVGYTVLKLLYDSVKGRNYSYINYVCVLEKYRNMGIGTKLLEKALEICKQKNISYVELTSRPSRIVAHSIYKKLGFEIRNTNVFRKEII